MNGEYLDVFEGIEESALGGGCAPGKIGEYMFGEEGNFKSAGLRAAEAEFRTAYNTMLVAFDAFHNRLLRPGNELLGILSETPTVAELAKIRALVEPSGFDDEDRDGGVAWCFVDGAHFDDVVSVLREEGLIPPALTLVP